MKDECIYLTEDMDFVIGITLNKDIERYSKSFQYLIFRKISEQRLQIIESKLHREKDNLYVS